jgi:hypothetical protein
MRKMPPDEKRERHQIDAISPIVPKSKNEENINRRSRLLEDRRFEIDATETERTKP